MLYSSEWTARAFKGDTRHTAVAAAESEALYTRVYTPRLAIYARLSHRARRVPAVCPPDWICYCGFNEVLNTLYAQIQCARLILYIYAENTHTRNAIASPTIRKFAQQRSSVIIARE